MLIIYGADLSGPSNKVRFVANFLEIPYEYRRVKLREGETRTPEFLRKHPAGKIPVIDDGGFILFESNAIIRYLADKNRSELYPSEAQARALVEQWMDFVTQHVGEASRRIVFNRVFAPILKVPVSEEGIGEGQGLLNRFLPIVENQFAQGDFLAGKAISLADFNLLSVLDPAEIANIDLTAYPCLQNWRKRLQSMAFYTKCYVRYGESLKDFRESSG